MSVKRGCSLEKRRTIKVISVKATTTANEGNGDKNRRPWIEDQTNSLANAQTLFLEASANLLHQEPGLFIKRLHLKQFSDPRDDDMTS